MIQFADEEECRQFLRNVVIRQILPITDEIERLLDKEVKIAKERNYIKKNIVEEADKMYGTFILELDNASNGTVSRCFIIPRPNFV